MEKNNNHPIQDLPLEEGQIIIYQPNETIKVEVKMEDETVWLTQIQMTELFQTSKQNVSLHINNIFKEGELEKEAVVKESLTTEDSISSPDSNMFLRCREMFCLLVSNTRQNSTI